MAWPTIISSLSMNKWTFYRKSYMYNYKLNYFCIIGYLYIRSLYIIYNTLYTEYSTEILMSMTSPSIMPWL